MSTTFLNRSPDPSRTTSSPAATPATPPQTSERLSSQRRDLPEIPTMAEDIRKLNGNGDSAFQRISPSVSADANVRAFELGATASQGGTIRVTQVGEGADASFTVRYDKTSGLGATGAIGTDTLGGKTGKASPGEAAKPPVKGNLNAEVGAETVDAVEMTFTNKEDAIRATQTLQRLQLADAMDDAAGFLARSGPMGPVLSGLDRGLSGGGQNPLGNPLNDDGAPGRISRKIAGVSQQDLDFLQQNVSAHESSLAGKSTLGGDLKVDAQLFNLAGAGQISGEQRLSRRVEMPRDGKDGTVSYTLQGGLNASASEKLGRGFEMNGLPISASIKNQLPLGNASTSISLQYSFPETQDPTTSGGGRPVPETGEMRLERVTIKNQLEARSQPLNDGSRWDSNRFTTSLVVEDPARLGAAADRLFQGDFGGAARKADARLDLEAARIRRDGYNISPGGNIDLGVGGIAASIGIEAGTDDVLGTRKLSIAPGAPAPQPEAVPQPQVAPDPKDDGRTLAVLPTQGAHLRDGPAGASVGITQNGSFLRHDGQRRTDAQGQDWLQVTGTDLRDQQVSGWVRADLTTAHDSTKGAMDETGRYNPSLERQRPDSVHVEKDDNLWDLAQRNGWDPQETVALNRDHLRNPSLIFKGDTVYVPGTARGALPPPVVTPEPEPPATAEPRTEDQGRSGPRISSERSGESAGKPGPSGLSGSAADAPEGPAAPATPPVDVPATSRGRDVPGRPDLAGILQDYQVTDDPEMVEWRPGLVNDVTTGVGSFLAGMADKAPGVDGLQDRFDAGAEGAKLNIPASEAKVLNRLGVKDQIEWGTLSRDMQGQAASAYQKPDGMSSREWENDGHADAYRHALWNARMTQDFGEDWTEDYATAHESVEGNLPEREAMDLYNNQIGRRIASDNPDANSSELDRLVRDAIGKGEMLVIDQNGDLAWSDQIGIGQHGAPAQ